MTKIEMRFNKNVDVSEIVEEIRETIEDKFGIEILEINEGVF